MENRAGLVHPCPDVRCAAFSCLCETKKRGTAPSGREMQLVLEFLERNATEDCTRFRQCLISQVSPLHLIIMSEERSANDSVRMFIIGL